MTLRILLLLSLLGLLMGHRLPAARAQDESVRIDLPEGLHAQLLGPTQLGLGWDESDALRLYVEFIPRDEAGRFEAGFVREGREWKIRSLHYIDADEILFIQAVA